MKIILMLFMILSCKGLNSLNPSYKDRTVTLKKIYLELRKDSIDLDKISSLLRDFERDQDEDVTINDPIDTELKNVSNEGLQSLMHLAVMSHDPKSLEVMKLLKTNMDANVNSRNQKGETPLHLACELGDKDKIRLLLKMGADINLEDNYGTTPLVAHILGDSLSWEVFNEFLGSLWEVNVKIEPELKTMLHLLCDNFWKNHEAAANIIKMLAREGSDFKARDIKGNTLLHSVVLASIAHGVEPNVTIEMIDLLMRYGVDPKAINKDNNRTILHIATEYAMDEDVIRYLTDVVGAIQPEPYKVVEDRFIEMIKSYGNVDIEGEGKKNTIHDTLQALWIQEDDFTQENTKFLKLLAALFYARWTNDEFVPGIPLNNNVDIYQDVDKTLSLRPLIELIENVDKDIDLDDDLKGVLKIGENRYTIDEIIEISVKKIVSMENNEFKRRESSPLIKVKLQKLVSSLPNIINQPSKKRFVINTILRQFIYCEIGITLGLDQIFRYLGENVNENSKIENLIHQYLTELRKITLLDSLRMAYKNVGVHFELQVSRHFSDELNLMEEYEDPFKNLQREFDPNIIRDKFYEKYNYLLILETLKGLLTNANISAKLFEYVQEISGGKNVHLVYKIFFDKDDYSTKEEFIKALLLVLGYIKSKR